MTAPKVYAAIQAVMKAVGVIGKDRHNPQQNYAFRGVDDVMAEIQGHLVAANLVILPRVVSESHEMLETKSGGRMRSVLLKVEHDFISTEDGSKEIVTTYGEAMDSGDKATNKAMSAAYKYAVTLGFCIPTHEPKDSENDSPQLAAPQKASTSSPKAPARPAVASGAVFPNWGAMAGKPVAGAPVKHLNYYAEAARKGIADPTKAKWLEANQKLLYAIEKELALGGKAADLAVRNDNRDSNV